MNVTRIASLAAVSVLLTAASLASEDGHAITSVPVPGYLAVQPAEHPRLLSRKSNIIFIMADDLGYGDLGCYGSTTIQTPRIDRMATEGTRFTACYAGAPVCAPTRSVLMTGQHCGHTRVRHNMSNKTGHRVPLEPEDVTVAEVLKGAGYVTGMTGKWGLGEPRTTGIPNKQGFDEWFGYLNQKHAHTYYPEYLWKNEEKVTYPGNSSKRKTFYSHDAFTEFALDFVKRHQNEPFFLYVPYCIPHASYQVPELEPYTKSARASMVTRMDRHVGQIIDLVDELGLGRNTYIFFCSDNGSSGGSSGKLRGGKRDIWEGGIRTPMVVRCPGKVPANKVSDAPWYYPDVMATFAAMAGVAPPAETDGMNILPTLHGEAQVTDDRIMYWEYTDHKRGSMQAVRWKQWKALRQGPKLPVQLYDVVKDTEEKTDVSARHPDIVVRLTEAIETARIENPDFPLLDPSAEWMEKVIKPD